MWAKALSFVLLVMLCGLFAARQKGPDPPLKAMWFQRRSFELEGFPKSKTQGLGQEEKSV